MATQYRRPIGTTSDGDFIAVGATELHDCVNEVTSDDDATYIKKEDAESNGYIAINQKFMINAVADTMNVYAVNVFRHTSDSPNTNGMQFQFRLRVNGTYKNGASTDTTTSYQTITDEWTTNPKTAAEWTEDEVNGVAAGDPLEMTNNRCRPRSLVSGDELRLTQTYLYVTYTEEVTEGSMGLGMDLDVGSFPGK